MHRTSKSMRRSAALAGVACGVLCAAAAGATPPPALPAVAPAEPTAPHENEVLLAVTPLSLGWHFGSHPSQSDSKIDGGVIGSAGFVVGYGRHVTEYFRFGPRLEYIYPIGARRYDLHEVRVLIEASAVFPVLDGDLELSAGVDGGLAVYAFHLDGDTSMAGDSTVPGYTVGLLLGLRGWVSDNVALSLDLGPTWSDAPSNDEGFGLEHLRLVKASFGAVVGW